MIPQVGPAEPVFVGSRNQRRVTDGGSRYVLRRALKELGFSDAARLDFHSFRRGWNTSAHREGVPDDVARKQTGQSLQTFQSYMANADDRSELPVVVEKVRSLRNQ